MTPKVPTDLLDKLFKPDFCKDTLCMANTQQQKSCINYKQYDGTKYPICKFWGTGTCCERVKE